MVLGGRRTVTELLRISKCDPEVREMFHKNGDKVKLEWGMYTLRDRYHALACFHCQRYGHTIAKCTVKAKDEDPCHFKCSGNHKSNECQENERKCINCMRYKKSDASHSVNDYRCPILIAEIDKIRNLTDHGY